MSETLGEFLNAKRLAKKITFAQLANNCKMATPTIWKVIKDKARPKDLTLQALSEALDVPLTKLFEVREKTSYPSSKRKPGRPKKVKEQIGDDKVSKEKLMELIRVTNMSEHMVEALYYLVQVAR
ncbi:MAG TPA: helix-turn-helix transcriptional regulator [Caldisericia bacterium]|nr:helix-turn-helix transcriptional regulator [Caldisericia bacterium]HPF49594.1 helix-turn-helix transcriptional regulator [Caldisericia bacterium]HPI84490.1 helix-turn-helix transcriptional regulator [Caldisericia bacterium]HPQ93856.1 helix-turn-helix transcriptional regulator [Caldisericia bacterium]HRV75401.1 helix-turn-helix transcriptional regulator [Caldisericia bacterium]